MSGSPSQSSAASPCLSAPPSASQSRSSSPEGVDAIFDFEALDCTEEPFDTAPPIPALGTRFPRSTSPRRDATLALVRANGRALAHVELRYRQDPDVVLAAISQWPRAVQHASEQLQTKTAFGLEAVHRRWETLEFLPEALQADIGVVSAAGRQSREALKFAAKTLQGDRQLVSRARARGSCIPPAYEGENMRLVGPCNRWNTADARLRFTATKVLGKIQHHLLVQVDSGYLSFQVISCMRLFALRLLPTQYGDNGNVVLARGAISARTAELSGDHHGHGGRFCIKESPGTVIRICCEIPVDGDAVVEGVALWYIYEHCYKPKEVVSLAEDPEKHNTKCLRSRRKPVANQLGTQGTWTRWDVRSRPQRTWMPSNPQHGTHRLICFLASHISSAERAERFAETLQSISGQTPSGPPQLYVSWSASTKELRAQTNALLGKAAAGSSYLYSLEQKEPQSQFQHLLKCCEAVRCDVADEHCWIMFSDDDDLWHATRCSEFVAAIGEINEDSKVWCVVAKSHVQLCCVLEARAANPGDVDELLDHGMAHEQDESPEYFDAAVRLSTLKEYFKATSPFILANKFCDRRLVATFCGTGEVHARWFWPYGWLYYYCRCGGVTLMQHGGYAGGASFGVEVSREDERWAAQEMQKSRAAKGHLAGISKEEVSFFLASMKLAMQERVVTLGKTVHPDNFRHMCRRLVKSRWSRYEGGQEEMKKWAVAVAWDLGLEACKTVGVTISSRGAMTAEAMQQE